MRLPKTLLIDFDGTIHPYNKRFSEYDHEDVETWDAPTEETKAALEAYVEVFDVKVFSTRCRTEPGIWLMREYLALHGFSKNFQKKIGFTAEKGLHHLIIDDRGFHFEGVWPSVEWVESFKPHNKREAK